MKKLIPFFTLLFLAIPLLSPVFSQEEEEATPTTQPEATDKIEELKEKVAERVAELKKGKASGLYGVVKSATEEAFILTVDGDEYSVQLDEDAKVYSIDTRLRKKEVKLSDFEKDTKVSMIGTVNTEEKTAVATVVVSRTPNLIITGTVMEVSTKDGTITVEDLAGSSSIVDIEVTTDINTFDAEENEIAEIGLSKIETEVTAIVYGYENEDGNITGNRILILPNGFETLSIEKPTETPTPEPTTTEDEE